jgi:hypothetical protein
LKLTIIFLVALLFTGCSHMRGYGDQVVGSGVIKTEKRQVSSFTSVEASGSFNVEIVCQKEPSLEIEGDDNLLPLLKTEVRGGTLYLKPDKSYSTKKGIHVRVTVQNLESINSSGASSFNVTDVKNEKLNIDISGASNINVSGETKTLEMDMSGASKINTESLRAEKVTVSLSGAGKANVYASQEINADVSGAGSVTYAGDPKVVNPKVSGVGTVSKK